MFVTYGKNSQMLKWPCLTAKIRKDVIKLRKEIELAEQTIEQIKNDTIDVNTKTNNWLNDSYNLLFQGKV